MRTSVDQVTGEPEPVALVIEGDEVQEGEERLRTSLNVSDRVRGHVSAALPSAAPQPAVPTGVCVGRGQAQRSA